MLHIAIVEDEDLYAQQLWDYIRRFETERKLEIQVTRFTDGDEIIENYRSDFDVILMDIQMQFVDGMAAAEVIRTLDSEVVIMFITNMTQYAIRGYEVNALDYIVKPIEYFSFSQKLNRALERVKRKAVRYIAIPIHTGIRKLAVDRIFYVESQGHKLLYHTKDGVVESRGAMKETEEQMSAYGFYRSNKGFLVNMKFVDGISEGCCVINGERLPISRAKKQEFMETLANYMGEDID